MGYKEDSSGSGRFEVWYSKRHPLTRQVVSLRRKGIASRAEAKRVEAQLIVEVENRLRATLLPKWSRSLEALFESMRNRGLSEKTIQNYELSLRAHTEAEWSERIIDTISTREIRELVQRRVGGTSVGNQQNLLKFIRAVFQCAIEDGYIRSNPTPQMRVQAKDRVKRVLTEPQVRIFLDRARSDESEWYWAWAMAIYTGMRSGELYALTWDKVDFDSRQIVVDRAWNSKDGFKGTKSGHDRIVPINETLLQILRSLKLLRGNEQFVLPRQDKWAKGEQARELQKFLIGIGLPPVKFHDLRATWATLLLSRGIQPAKVMKMGGWRDMKTMMIYVRMAGIDIRGATDCLALHSPSAPKAEVIELRGGQF